MNLHHRPDVTASTQGIIDSSKRISFQDTAAGHWHAKSMKTAADIVTPSSSSESSLLGNICDSQNTMNLASILDIAVTNGTGLTPFLEDMSATTSMNHQLQPFDEPSGGVNHPYFQDHLLASNQEQSHADTSFALGIISKTIEVTSSLDSTTPEVDENHNHHAMFFDIDKDLLEPTPIGPKPLINVVENETGKGDLAFVNNDKGDLLRLFQQEQQQTTTVSPSYVQSSELACGGAKRARSDTTEATGATSPFKQEQVMEEPHRNKRARRISTSSYGSNSLGAIDKVQNSSEELDASQRNENEPRFRDYQTEQWTVRYQELFDFHKEHGHCQVPYTVDNENKALARWVKRQRYQYRLRMDGKPSVMTQKRIDALENIGFVWDSHTAAWEDRLQDLLAFRRQFQHCNVPSNYPANPSLASWVKCQRRQYKLFCQGKKESNITMERIIQLEKVGFEWEIRRKVFV